MNNLMKNRHHKFSPASFLPASFQISNPLRRLFPSKIGRSEAGPGVGPGAGSAPFEPATEMVNAPLTGSLSSATDYVLNLNQIGRQFGTDEIVYALQDVDLQLARGEWLSITGPSGAGKSTLLNILGCLDRATSGSYHFDDIDIAKLSDKQRAGLRSRRIGFVFQSFHLLPHRSVLENVMLAEVYRKQGYSGRKERALEAIRRVGLSDRADFLPSKLSGGQRQRVAIARALVGSPSLLLCDEPTGNLDSESTESILKLFDNLNEQGLTVVIVTHEDEVAKRASRQVQIVDGRLTEITPKIIPQPSIVPANFVQNGLGVPNPAVNISVNGMPKNGSAGDSIRGGKTWGDNAWREDSWPGHSNEALGSNAAIYSNGPAQPAKKEIKSLRSGMTLRDLVDEAVAGMFARPGRMALTVLGILIGLTALVATLGLSRTAGNQIVTQFDELSATEIVVTSKSGSNVDTIPWDAPARLARLNGVVAAGLLSEIDIGDTLVSSSPVKDPQSQTDFSLAVLAASPELFPAVRAKLEMGRLLDSGHSQRADRVAVLGPNAAQKLGVSRLEQLPAIAVGDYLYLVIGILSDVERRPELLGAVIIPEGTAMRDFGLMGPDSVVIETRIGAASLIAKQSSLALRPDNPSALKVEYPPEPQRVRGAVQGDLNVMFLLLGGLSLVVGAIGIGNITLVSVIERTGEIGLRRAIGATRTHIAAQFLLESTSMGIIGGVLGSCLGLIIVVAVSAYQMWTPVLDPSAPFITPLIGGAIGLLSGTYPALRAARLEPVEAFRN